MKTLSHSEALIFGLIELILMAVLVFVCAKLIKALGETFHGRNTFNQSFTVAAYGLGPVFTMRIFDMFSSVSGWAYWATWGVGIVLTFAILYLGIPKVLLPDPPHAFGLYMTSCVFLLMVSGLIRFLTYSFLQGKFGNLNSLMDTSSRICRFCRRLISIISGLIRRRNFEMNETERALLQALVELDAAVKSMPTANHKPKPAADVFAPG